MLIALDEFNNRISPIKGKKAFCPICKNKVIAAIGNIIIPYWRHESESNCDPWKEHETEWHRTWKDRFPFHWKEVIIEHSGETHRADIKTDNGLVLEIQNSSISSTTIEIREEFYQKMVWLINAKNFKENFSIHSVVKTKLGELKRQKSPSLSDFEIENELKPLKRKLDEYYAEIRLFFNRPNEKRIKIREYQNKKDQIKQAITEIIQGVEFFSPLRNFKSDITVRVSEILNRIEKLENQTQINSQYISKINLVSNCSLRGFEHYKIMSFESVAPKYFKQCKVFDRKSAGSLFPEVIDLQSESNFRWYSSLKNQYSLIVDFTQNIHDFVQQNEKNQTEIDSLQTEKENLLLNIEIELKEWLDLQIFNTEQELLDLETQIAELETSKLKTLEQIDIQKKELIESSRKEEELFQKSIKMKEPEIKVKYKGLYSYHWSYRRKTWDFAQRPLFLDFDDHIFEMRPDDLLRKISYDEFIERIKNWR